MKKIALCGTPKFVSKFFDAIMKSGRYDVKFCITQPARKKDRGSKVQPCDISVWAKQNNIECFEIEKISESTFLNERLKELDCVLVFAFGKIIPKYWLELTCWLNIHPSILPELRGPSPIQYLFLQNKTESGITLMKMNEKMDEGDIIAQKFFTVPENLNKNSLLFEICMFAPDWVEEKIYQFLEGEIIPTKQGDNATYSRLICKADHNLQFGDDVIAKIKGLGFVNMKICGKAVKCFCARVADENSFIDIDGIEPIYVQIPGKKLMHIRAFLNGIRYKKDV